MSSAVEAVSAVSVAPTVIAKGSLPGAYSIVFGPRLPADTTTAIPACHRRSTAASRALVRYELAALSESEIETTRILSAAAFAATQSRPTMTSLE